MALDPIQREVDEDCACRKCGYNLRGQTAKWDRWKNAWRATCPDCAHVQLVRLWSEGRRAQALETAANRVICAVLSAGFGVIASVLFAAGHVGTHEGINLDAYLKATSTTLVPAFACLLAAIVLVMFTFPMSGQDDGRYPDPTGEPS